MMRLLIKNGGSTLHRRQHRREMVCLADTIVGRAMKFAKLSKTVKNAADEIRQLGRGEVNSLGGTLHSLGVLAATLESEESFDTTLRMHHQLLQPPAARYRGEAEQCIAGGDYVRVAPRVAEAKVAVYLGRAEGTPRKGCRASSALASCSVGGYDEHLAQMSHDSRRDCAQDLQDLRRRRGRQTVCRYRASGSHRQERQRILDFFLKVNPQAYYETSRRLRHPLTGLWLTHVTEFQSWFAKPNSNLWLSGMPGARQDSAC